MSKKKTLDIDFETAIIELSKIVEEMEHGELTLETSLKKFERGILLTRQCQAILKNAEQQVKILVENNGHKQLENFEDQI